MDGLLVALGWDAQALVAGAAGGIVAVLVLRKTKPFDAVGSVIVGMCAANYLWPLAAQWVPGGAVPAGKFLAGMGGMAICQAFLVALRKWAPSWARENGNGKRDVDGGPDAKP